VVEGTLELQLRKQEVGEGSLLMLRDGRVDDSDRFAPDRSFVEQKKLPAVRAPAEGSRCLDRLAALVAA
jgi:hypothetical protein